ncbi:MAG: glycosyltransferase family 39 protein [Leptospirales bacterium]
MKIGRLPAVFPALGSFLRPGPLAVLALMVVPFCIRLYLIGKFDLGNDEAHYYMYAVHPDFSFFDHPLMIGLLISKSMSWWGTTEFGVRFFAPTLFLLSSILMALLSWRLIPSWKFVVTVQILLNAVPLFGLLGSTLFIPDDPLSVFWLLYLYILISFIPTLSRIGFLGKFTGWVLLGMVFGLALLSKYNAVLLPVMTAGFMISRPSTRKYLLEPAPWIGLGTGLLLAWPLFYWNYLHQGASFLFQAKHGFGAIAFNWVHLYQMLLGQIAYLSPILWVLILLSLLYLPPSIRRMTNERDRMVWTIVAWFGLFPLAFFNGIGFFHPILPHWPAMGYMTGILALSYQLQQTPISPWTRWTTRGVWLGASLSILVLLQLTVQLLVLPKTFPRRLALAAKYPFLSIQEAPLPRWVDMTNDLYGFKRLARHLSGEGETAPGAWAFYVSDHFNTADELAFYLHAPERTLCLEPAPNQFDYWSNPGRFIGKNGIFISTDKYPTDPGSLFPAGTFRKIIPERPFSIYRNNHLARTFYIYRLIGFNRLPWKKGQSPQ